MADKLADVDDPSLPVFAVVFDDGTIRAANGKYVSEIHDLADCDGMDGVKAVYAPDQDGELVKITIGKSRQINTDDEYAFRYAASPIMAGTRRVGTVVYTDH